VRRKKMNTRSNKTMLRIMMMAILVTGLFFVSANPAMANAAFWLFVNNGDTVPVTITFTAGHCYNGGTASGQIFKNVAPGKTIRIHGKRDQGSRCDGDQGNFSLKFSPTAGGGNHTQDFNFSNNGILGLSNTPNAYPGKFSRVSGKICSQEADCNGGRDFLFTTSGPADKITAGVSVGEWEFICSRECAAVKVTTSITESRGKDMKEESTTREAIKVSMEAGIEIKGFSAKTSVEGESERSHSKSMSSSFMTMKSEVTEIDTKIYDMDWMEKNNVKAIWQWKVTTPYTEISGQKSEIEIKTRFITCTADEIAPKYYPGSPGHLNACKAKSK
jgi:hypothetical protein